MSEEVFLLLDFTVYICSEIDKIDKIHQSKGNLDQIQTDMKTHGDRQVRREDFLWGEQFWRLSLISGAPIPYSNNGVLTFL